jgi:hypothetical protein
VRLQAHVFEAKPSQRVPQQQRRQQNQGVVPVGEVQKVTVSIEPTDASTFVARAVLHIGEGEVADIETPVLTLPVSAVGKYPYLCLSEQSLDFGDVLIGTPADSVSAIHAPYIRAVKWLQFSGLTMGHAELAELLAQGSIASKPKRRAGGISMFPHRRSREHSVQCGANQGEYSRAE